MPKVTELETLLPIYKVENGCVISMQGDVTVAWKVSLSEIFTLSDKDYEALHNIWIRAIRVLPPHSVFHKQDYFIEDSYHADFTREDDSFLSRGSERFFHERPFLNHSCYVFLTRKPQGRKQASSAFSNLLRSNLVPPESISEQWVQDFLDTAGQFARILSDSGMVSLKRLSDDDLAGSGHTAGMIERYCLLLEEEEPSFVRDIHIQSDIRIGHKHCRMYTLSDVEDLPGLCGPCISYDKYSTDRSRFSTAFASPLGMLLPCSHIYNQFIFIGDTNATIKALESKRLRLQSLSAYSRENAIAMQATHDFLNEAVSGQRLPVKAHFNVMLWSEETARLKELRNMVSSALAQMDIRAKEETDGAPQIFWAALPGNEADFPDNDTFDTFLEQAVCFLNQETAYRSSISPVGIRLGDRLTGKPVHVDISDEPMRLGYTTNRNKFILGPSGSGKSFFTNHMVRSYYEQGAHIVLVDVGHSYKGLCDLVGGYYFTYDEKRPVSFNPFFMPGNEKPDTEKKESIKTMLLALWKKDNEGFNRSEYVALSSALEMYYRRLATYPDIFPCFDSFYEFLRDTYTAVVKTDRVKRRDFDIDNLLYVLRPYYKGGEFDFLLNARENLDMLGERFIVFELDNIRDHAILFPVVTLIIMEVFISKMRRLKGIRKMILIEEAWKAIAREGMGEYIKFLFKTVRKFFGEAIVVTQEVDDIISSPIVKDSIINNSDCKILLDQSKYQNKFDQIQDLLGLTDKEKAQVLSINRANEPGRIYKEVFISLGGQISKVYRTEVSDTEYLAYTTEESEKMKVQEYAARYGSMHKGISVLAAERRNTGTQKGRGE